MTTAAPPSPPVLPYSSADHSSKNGVVRFHPLRRLRIERWTPTHLVAAGAMALLGMAATWSAWYDILDKAIRETEYSHIFLVPIVAVWMVWARRLRIRHCKPIGVSLGVIIAGLGWWLHAYGYYHGIQTFWHAGAVLVPLGCALSVLGKHAIFRFFPAAAVLVFLIPVPQQYRLMIAQPLQSWTAEVAQAVLELVQIPVKRAGDQLLVNNKKVEIIEACNGLRMVFALIMVSYAFSFGLPLRNGIRVLVLLASPISAIVCNVVRIVPTAVVHGYVSKAAGDRFHDVSMWVMLPVSFLILLGVIRLLRWAMLPVMKFSLAA